jgi:hypothetical protein
LAADALVGRPARTHGGVVGQVCRHPSRQVRLNRVIATANVVPLDVDLGRRAGLLLAQSPQSDVIDAAVVLLARDGDTILTSDVDDLLPLLILTGTDATLVAV